MSRNELRGLFSRHLPSAALQTALDALVNAGKVRQTKEQTPGRPVEQWEWIA
ncbi:MAG TPA: DNA/RNA-binding winged helix domain-containing protein [Ktedonobacterales bacterium]|nr:DNA/RNA-binding winged helix domain-containing protein [Ktedonobacterales bacterium]